MAGRPRKHRGFTLPELLTTLAVAGIALSLAVPGLNQAVGDQRRAGAINELVGTLHLARSVAITTNAPVTVCASRDGRSCTADGWEQGWLAFTDEALRRDPAGGEMLAVGGPVDAALRIRSARFSRYLSYRPNGQVMVDRLDENTGSFVICDPRGAEATRQLQVLVSGQARLDDRQADSLPPACRQP